MRVGWWLSAAVWPLLPKPSCATVAVVEQGVPRVAGKRRLTVPTLLCTPVGLVEEVSYKLFFPLVLLPVMD